MNFIKEHKQGFLNVAVALVLAVLMMGGFYTKAAPAETYEGSYDTPDLSQIEDLTEFSQGFEKSVVEGSYEDTFIKSLHNDSRAFEYTPQNTAIMIQLMEDKTSHFALINPEHTLTADFVPELTGSGKGQMEQVAAKALDIMLKDAKNQGLVLNKQSGYRSFERQTSLYGNGSNEFRAAPGASEHQTGLAMDLVNSAGVLEPALSTSPEAVWLLENAWKYGFVIRYTEEKADITGYPAEWWHVRYVGKTLAYELYHSGMAYEEFYEICLIEAGLMEPEPYVN